VNGALEIQKKLYADSTVNTYTAGKIAIGTVEPESWAHSDKTCLIYQVSPEDHTLEYYQCQFTVNCRSPTEIESSVLAGYVVSAINRKSSISGGFMTCSTAPVIEPLDSTDNYNTPVTVIVKGKPVGGN